MSQVDKPKEIMGASQSHPIFLALNELLRSIWKLVRGCHENQRYNEAVKNGQATLKIFQEERSEQTDSEEDIENSESVDSEEEL